MSTVAADDGKAGQVLFLLPGAQMTAQHIAEEGLLALAAERRPALTVVPLNLGQEGIYDPRVLQRLDDEILSPARRQYRHVWLGGISLGGLLSLAYVAQQLGRIDGLCMLAPYPGSRLTLNAIAQAGGLGAWTPTAEQLDDVEFRVWHWLQSAVPALPMFIGYGAQDRFASGIRQLAQCLPAARIEVIDGGHDWAAWRTLWSRFLDDSLPEA